MKEFKVFNDKLKGTKRDPHRRQVAGRREDQSVKMAKRDRKARLGQIRERELMED